LRIKQSYYKGAKTTKGAQYYYKLVVEQEINYKASSGLGFINMLVFFLRIRRRNDHPVFHLAKRMNSFDIQLNARVRHLQLGHRPIKAKLEGLHQASFQLTNPVHKVGAPQDSEVFCLILSRKGSAFFRASSKDTFSSANFLEESVACSRAV
jgi:hypothetical protein